MPRRRKTYDKGEGGSSLVTPGPMAVLESPSELDTRVLEKEGEESSDDDVTMHLIDAEKGHGKLHRYRVHWTDGAITWEAEEDVQGTAAFQYFLWEPVVCNLSDAFQKTSKKRPAPRPAPRPAQKKGVGKCGVSTGKENKKFDESPRPDQGHKLKKPKKCHIIEPDESPLPPDQDRKLKKPKKRHIIEPDESPLPPDQGHKLKKPKKRHVIEPDESPLPPNQDHKLKKPKTRCGADKRICAEVHVQQTRRGATKQRRGADKEICTEVHVDLRRRDANNFFC